MISKHFPEKAKEIPPQAIENLAVMIRQGRFTTTSASLTILALDSYAKEIEARGEVALKIEAISRDANSAARTISTLNGAIATGKFAANDRLIAFQNPAKLPAWYLLTQAGYDTAAPTEPLKKGVEVFKEYTNEAGQKASEVALGEKITVTIRVKSLSSNSVGNVAIVDLLPGGFEIVQQPRAAVQRESDGDYDDEEGYYEEPSYSSPITFAGSTWAIDYADAREDRVIIYGTIDRDTRSFSYQIKATNAGVYQSAPIYAEAMYDREIQGLGVGLGKITILPAK